MRRLYGAERRWSDYSMQPENVREKHDRERGLQDMELGKFEASAGQNGDERQARPQSGYRDGPGQSG